jgi:hypothetical protein
MSDFDKLRRALRECLRYADHNWSGTNMLRARRNPKKHPQVAKLSDAIEFVRQAGPSSEAAHVHRGPGRRGVAGGGAGAAAQTHDRLPQQQLRTQLGNLHPPLEEVHLEKRCKSFESTLENLPCRVGTDDH